MKTKLTLFLLLAPMLLFGQMKREVLTYNGIQYLKYTPTTMAVKGAILYLHGIGEKGTDPTLIENNEIPKQLKNGLEVPYIVVAPQLPSNQGGWWANTTDPIISMMQTYNLNLHLTGISLGGMVIATLVYQKPGVFKTAASVCGKFDPPDNPTGALMITAMSKIPSIHYYDPTDVTIPYGYGSIKSMCDQLKAQSADVTFITLTGNPSPHVIWPQAYATNQYWQWLASKVTPTPPPPTTVAIDKQYRIGDDMFIESGGQVFKVALTPN